MNSNYITYDQFKSMPGYQKFLEENPSQGILKVQAFTADQAIPIADAEVYITKNIDGQDVLFFEGKLIVVELSIILYFLHLMENTIWKLWKYLSIQLII